MDVNKLIEDRKAQDEYITSTVDAGRYRDAVAKAIETRKATIAKRIEDYKEDPYYLFENSDTMFRHAAEFKLYSYVLRAASWHAENFGKEPKKDWGDLVPKERLSHEDVKKFLLEEFRYHNPMGNSTSPTHNIMAAMFAKVLHDALYSGFGEFWYSWRDATYSDPLVKEVYERRAAVKAAEKAAQDAIEAQQKREERNRKSRESKARNRKA